MNKFIKLIKSTVILLGIMAGTSQLAHAGSGWCEGTNSDTFNFDSTATGTGNTAGSELKNLFIWGTGKTYPTVCDCASALSYRTYIRAKVPAGLTPARTKGGLNYYSLNKYLEVASEVWIEGNQLKYIASPFTDAPNTTAFPAASSCGTSQTSYPFTTGSRGRLSFYVTKSFVGQVAIPTTKILDIYYSAFSGSYGSPGVSIYMTGTLTGRQNCKINAGQMINVDFGNIKANDISVQGQSNVPEKQVTASLDCTNMDASVNLTMSFRGIQNGDDPTALATSNNDIGIRVKDVNRQTITPNQDDLPVNFDVLSGKGSATMFLQPINTTGRAPDTGPFNATATLNAEMQ